MTAPRVHAQPVPRGQATTSSPVCQHAHMHDVILLVQSEPLLRRAMARLLVSMGHTVLTPLQIAECAERPEYDCVVVDERDLWGVPPSACALPHVVLTAGPSPVRWSRGRALRKPFTAEELAQAILQVGLPVSNPHEDLPYSEFLSSIGVHLS